MVKKFNLKVYCDTKKRYRPMEQSKKNKTMEVRNQIEGKIKCASIYCGKEYPQEISKCPAEGKSKQQSRLQLRQCVKFKLKDMDLFMKQKDEEMCVLTEAMAV